MNPYEVLEISVGASPEEVKAAYHGLAKKWHPDRFSGAAKPEAELRFRMLAEAYNMLKDVPRREEPAGRPAAAAVPVVGGIPDPPQAQIQLDTSPEGRTGAVKSVEEWFKEAKAAAEGKSPDKALSLVQYAIRLDGERAEFHALHGKLLDETKGDRRSLVRALETALKLNPKDVESTILLAKTFQGLGMHARASRLWGVAHNLAPNHAVFAPAAKLGIKGKKSTEGNPLGMGEQFASLVAEAKQAISRIFNRG